MGPSGVLPGPAFDPWPQPGARGHEHPAAAGLGAVGWPLSYGTALLPPAPQAQRPPRGNHPLEIREGKNRRASPDRAAWEGDAAGRPCS